MPTPDDVLPLILDDLLAPVSASDFFTHYWLKVYCHVHGRRSKFAGLLPWKELNAILEQHSLEFPRLRLVKAGNPIDSSSYTEHRSRDGKIHSKIVAKEFTDHLRNGATMTLDHIDRLSSSVNLLAEAMERRFSSNVTVNAYVAFRTCQGVNVHCDDHEVFVLQVSGKKRWLIYAKDRKIDDPSALPPDALFDVVLAEGDLLYIPRGAWHAAVPLDEPCLHLTVSVSVPSASQILSWVSSELQSGEIGQTCVSPLGSESDRLSFIDRLKNEVTAELDVDLVNRYFESQNSTRTAAQHISLPWAATPSGLPDDHCVSVRLSGRRAASLVVDSARTNVEFASGGKTWRFPFMMKPILEVLCEGRFVPLHRLLAIGRETVGEQMARAFIGTLVKGGVVFLVSLNDDLA